MPKMENSHIVFKKNECTAELCPICQSDDLDYGSADIIEGDVVYPFTCKKCGTEGKHYDKAVFDGYVLTHVPKGLEIPNLEPIKRIVVIEDGYIRDAQIFTADPAIMETDPEWENNYRDLKAPCHYIGIFTGASESEIMRNAAESAGVHPDVISLIEI